MSKYARVKTALLIGALAVSAPVFAQNDFSGEWQPVRNQDNSENPLVGDASIQSLPVRAHIAIQEAG